MFKTPHTHTINSFSVLQGHGFWLMAFDLASLSTWARRCEITPWPAPPLKFEWWPLASHPGTWYTTERRCSLPRFLIICRQCGADKQNLWANIYIFHINARCPTSSCLSIFVSLRWMSPRRTCLRTYRTGRCIPWTAIIPTLCWWKRIPTDQEPPVKWGWSCSSTSLFSALVMEVKSLKSLLGPRNIARILTIKMLYLKIS